MEDLSLLSVVSFLLISAVIIVFVFRAVLFVFFDVLPTIGGKGVLAISAILTVWVLWSVCQIPGVAAFYVDTVTHPPGTRAPIHNPMLDRDRSR